MINKFEEFLNEAYMINSKRHKDLFYYFFKNNIDLDFKEMSYDYPSEKSRVIEFNNLMGTTISIEKFINFLNETNVNYVNFYFFFKGNDFTNFFMIITNNNRYIISYKFKIIYSEVRNNGGFGKFVSTFFLFEDAANKGEDYVKQMQKLRGDFGIFEED